MSHLERSIEGYRADTLKLTTAVPVFAGDAEHLKHLLSTHTFNKTEIALQRETASISSLSRFSLPELEKKVDSHNSRCDAIVDQLAIEFAPVEPSLGHRDRMESAHKQSKQLLDYLVLGNGLRMALPSKQQQTSGAQATTPQPQVLRSPDVPVKAEGLSTPPPAAAAATAAGMSPQIIDSIQRRHRLAPHAAAAAAAAAVASGMRREAVKPSVAIGGLPMQTPLIAAGSVLDLKKQSATPTSVAMNNQRAAAAVAAMRQTYVNYISAPPPPQGLQFHIIVFVYPCY